VLDGSSVGQVAIRERCFVQLADDPGISGCLQRDAPTDEHQILSPARAVLELFDQLSTPASSERRSGLKKRRFIRVAAAKYPLWRFGSG